MTQTVQLKLENVSKVFQRQTGDQLAVLQDINLEVYAGEIIGIIGTNGAGKSTLLNCLTGQLPLSNGAIHLNGQKISGQSAQQNAKVISRIFQDPRMGTAPRMTVFENLMLASRRGEKSTLRRSLTAKNLADMTARLAQFKLELENRLDVPIEALSGGQRQAIALIMATLKRPELLLLDEHTAALDPRTSKQVMQMTQQLIKEQQLTAIMITHQLSDALEYCDRIILMHKGRIQHVYTSKEIERLTTADLYVHLEQLLEAELTQ